MMEAAPTPRSPSSINGSAGHLHVDDGGDGETPVVLVHSFAGSGAHWTRQLTHLRLMRRAVTLDLRGHGQSDSPATGGYEVDALADDIAAVVDALGLDRFVLVGHSMGGTAAIAYAGAHADGVAGLVMVGAPGQSPPEQAHQVMAAMESDYEKTSEGYWKRLLTGARPEVEAEIRADMARVPRDAALTMIRAIFEYDPLPALRAYSGPKLIVDTPHGDSPGALYHLAPAIPRKVMTGTSHWPQLDQPVEFNRILDEFLAATS